MDKNNSFDWIAVQLQGQDKTFDDLGAMGVDPLNTNLQTKDFYKEKKKIKEMFTAKDGKFDDKAFNQFYSGAEKSLNAYKKADTSLGNVTADLWDDTSITRSLGLDIRKSPVKISLIEKDPFSNLNVARKSFLGLTEINKWTAPKKTVAEVAQGQKVIDGNTGKELNYTPEDTNLMNMFRFFDEPLVMASYDADVKDESGKTIHKRGEFKFDEKGLPRYETLAGRDPSGKKLLSRLDTFTKEDSYWNKFDAMDSDDMQKSLTGSIVKSAVQYAPMLIGGPLGAAYTAYYIASGLTQGGMEIVKSLDAISNGPNAKNGGLYKWANQMQGYAGQWQSGVSEHSQNNFATWENLLSMAVDSVYQLKSQKALVQWPMEIKKYQLARQLGAQVKNPLETGQKAFDAITDISKYTEKYGIGFVAAAQKMSENLETLQKYQKYASYMSTAYMAATSAVAISDVAETQGLDAKDKGFLYLGFTSALIPLFRTNLGRFVEGRIGGVDDLTKSINKATKEYASKYFPEMMKETVAKVGEGTVKGNSVKMMEQGKNLANKVFKMISIQDPRAVGTAMAAEGVEEMSEEILQKSLQGVYNGLAAAGIKSTQDDVAFDLDPGKLAKEVLLAGVGGAFGGAIFHYADRNYIKSFQSDNLMEYVTEGYGGKVLESITALKNKGQLGDVSLSAKMLTDTDGNIVDGMFHPVNGDNPTSQNDFIGDKLYKTVKVIEDLRKAYNIIEPNVTAENKNKFFQNIVDTKTDTDLRERIHNKAKEIYKLAFEIQAVDGLDSEATEGLLQKKAELKNAQKDLEYLQGDDSLDEFFRQGLFNIRTDISSKFGVKNRESMAQEMANKDYKSLTDSQKKAVDTKYQEYVNTTGEGGLRDDLKKAHKNYEEFSEVMESGGHYKELDIYKQSIESLRKYMKVGTQVYQPAGENDPVAVNLTFNLVDNFLQNMQNVKYVPDYIFNDIQRQVNALASSEANDILTALSSNPELTKISVNKGLKTGFSDKNVTELLKKLIGEKDFEELQNSPEYKDIMENKAPTSNYSTVKLLKIIAAQHQALDTSEYDQQMEVVRQIRELDTNEIGIAIDDYISGDADKNHPIIALFDQLKGFMKYVDDQIASGADSNEWDYLFFADAPERYVTTNFIDAKSGAKTPENEKDIGYRGFNLNNLYTSLLLKGTFDVTADGQDAIYADTINQIDTTNLDNSIGLIRDFDKDRIPSPLREVLKDGLGNDTYEFVESEMQNLKTVGTDNYLNSDPDFVAALDGHLAAVERVAALIEASATVNPLVNDFRKNHKGLIDSKFTDEVLSQIEEEDKSTLMHELGRIATQLKYLKDVNDYNRNNVLQRLLKEDGLELIQKVRSLRELTENPEIVQLIPSLMTIYEIPAINDYFNTYQTASKELKNDALHYMVKLEHAIFTEVSRLNADDKKKLVNLSFKPIVISDKSFYSSVDPEQPMNPNHRTIYLATIFGSSTLDFYKKYAGNLDTDTGLYDNITNSLYVPFVKQEVAVRMANMVMSGDADIAQYLFNAFTYEGFGDEDAIDYSAAAYLTEGTPNAITILGSPGTGKTTAVLSYILNMISEDDQNVLLLAPKDRQSESLKKSVADAGGEDKINSRSNTVRDFLRSLNLSKTDGTKLDLAELDKFAEHSPVVSSTKALREDFDSYLNRERTGILEQLAIYKLDGSLEDDIFNALSNLKIIVIDEFTHVNPVDIAVIARIVSLYNKTEAVKADVSKRITMINLGDENQMGYVNKEGFRRDFTSVSNSIVTQPLLTSLRTGWDLINNTLIDITRRTIDIKHIGSTLGSEGLTSTDVLQASKLNTIKMFHHESPEGTIGMKQMKAKGDITVADLDFILRNKDKIMDETTNKKNLVYVVNNKEEIGKAEALMRDSIGATWRNFVDIYTPDEVQGGEYAYSIIHARPNISGQSYDIVRTYEFLNTMLSRGTQATLLITDDTMTPYVEFENITKPKAINQIKITDKVKADVKADKQALMLSILRDYVPEEVKAAAPGKAAPGVVGAIPVRPLKGLEPIFKAPEEEKLVTASKISDVTAYATFSTKEDFDKIYRLISPGGLAFDIEKNTKAIEKVISSYKYYLLKRQELGEDNVILTENFRPYLSKYKYNAPVYYIEATKREGKDVLFGRSERNPKKKDDPTILLLKVKIESKEGGEPLVLTMGSLNDISSLKRKYDGTKPTDLSTADKRVVQFVKDLEVFLAGRLDQMKLGDKPVGESKNGVWTSKEFTQKEWDSLTKQWSSRLISGDTKITYAEFKELYPDFHITDPQVVVATLIDDNNKIILDADGTNPNYKDIWNKLKGKSIAFITEYKELQSLSPDELLEVYMKQLSLFNNPEFIKADAQGKLDFVNSVTDVIRIRPDFTIRYKPKMVKMIQLDNPRKTFLNFREAYLNAMKVSLKGKSGIELSRIFEKFDMSIYVKDRLLKSLITLDEFLKDPSNQAWFKTEVLKHQNTNAAERIQAIKEESLAVHGEVVDFDSNFEEVALQDLGALTLEDFRTQLHDLIYDKEKSIIRGKYETVERSSAKKNKKEIKPDVSEEDLKLILTENKQKDFSANIIDLNLLNLFRKTKSLNFAELIDLSLKALSDLPENPNFNKFNLSGVFKGGLIETVVISNRTKVKSEKAADNVLDSAHHYGDDFQFNFGGLQLPAYNIAFDKLLDTMVSRVATEEDFKETMTELTTKLEKLEDLDVPQSWLEAKLGVADVTDRLSKLDESDYATAIKIMDEAIEKMDSLNETVQLDLSGKPITDETVVAITFSPNGVVFKHTVESDIKSKLIESQKDFKGMTQPNIKLEFVEGTTKEVTFKTKAEEGDVFLVKYTFSDREIDVTRIVKEGEEEAVDIFELFRSLDNANRNFEQIWSAVVKDIGVKKLQSNDINVLKAIANRQDLITALGESLIQALSEGQIKLILGEDWKEKSIYDDKSKLHFDLMDKFLDAFVEDQKSMIISGMLRSVNNTLLGLGAEASTLDFGEVEGSIVEGETGDQTGWEQYADLVKARNPKAVIPKPQKKETPMDKMINDVKESDATSKRVFEMKVRELFKGAETQGTLKSVLDKLELLFRKEMAVKKITELGQKADEPGLMPADLSKVDSDQLSNEYMKESQDNSMELREYRQQIKDLNNYTTQKSKINC